MRNRLASFITQWIVYPILLFVQWLDPKHTTVTVTKTKVNDDNDKAPEYGEE